MDNPIHKKEEIGIAFTVPISSDKRRGIGNETRSDSPYNQKMENKKQTRAKKKITQGVLVLICVVIIVVGLINLISYINNAETNINQVDCFDRFSNKIQDATCDKETYNNIFIESGIDLLPIVLMTIFIMALLLMVLGFTYLYEGIFAK